MAYLLASTPRNSGKSWSDIELGGRSGGKTMTALWHNLIEIEKLFPRKRTKLLQSKSKQSRIVRVVIK